MRYYINPLDEPPFCHGFVQSSTNYIFKSLQAPSSNAQLKKRNDQTSQSVHDLNVNFERFWIIPLKEIAQQ